MEEIILIAILAGIIFYYRNKRTEYTESKNEWLIFFLLFLALITGYSIDLINHFTYIRFFILVLIFTLGVIHYYKRFRKLQLK